MTDPFRSPVRQSLLQMVVAEPGIKLTDAARILGCRSTNVRYHARVLVQAGLLEFRMAGGVLHLHPCKAADLPMPHQKLLRNPLNRAVLEIIAVEPGIPRGGIARTLGISRTRLDRRVEALQEAGLLECQRIGDIMIQHFPTEHAMAALMSLDG